MVLISAQTIVNKSPKCDTILFLDGTTKTVQVQEVKKSKVIYILCCEECAVPREFKLKEIDSIYMLIRQLANQLNLIP